ncbi:4-alpha-glucanotransferase [Jannaschia aquimarina]|uniref:4-alpha-glucanotransferase n=1 Tax=Jannaschia aquimarina TaxID=935700 RepID=A0A0D1CS18_9RHOB|nr:4-alpha-glucanotransferase [Jannaschia aquimarina]KIT17597.1 4-alpha-glucanotransferase [Jannaschia aquimarina]SNS71808.1 4-alpha-glucanotransferase [Jannaschia aquimarina]
MKDLARHYGLTLDYDSRPVPEETLRTVLRGLGQDPDAPPQGPPAPRTMEVPQDAACFLPPSLSNHPGWGVFCQLYEIRSARSWGIGDFADLADLATICGEAGADFIGINPVHALFTSRPDHCSPFSPSNRQFLNPLYIAPDKVGCTRPSMADGDLVDYEAVAQAKLPALRAAFDAAAPDAGFDAFVEVGGTSLWRHALFEALSHVHGGGWTGWPEPFHDPAGPAVRKFADENAAEIRFHLWLQWIASEQLAVAQTAAKSAGMRIGLYLDLAVGEALDGSAAWSGGDTILPGVTVGAPPDVFSESGQNWQLAAPSPTGLRARDFAPFRDMIEAQLRHAGALRVDHAMALWQLFLIPQGKDAAEGTHLRYPFADMLRTLGAVSRAREAIVIGEDLGFVPDGFRDAMNRANILSYRIVYFEQSETGFAAPSEYPEMALACLSTHDLPTFSAWRAGNDIDLREEHGLVSPEASAQHRAHRKWERTALSKAVGATGSDPDKLLDAVHGFIARTPCLIAGVRLADLVGPERPTNLPGVVDGYPNWKPRSPTPVEDIADHPAFVRTARIMREARPRP